MIWKDYINERLILDKGDYVIIKPKTDSRKATPLACPVCNYIMRSSNDEKSYEQFTCCEKCENTWARPQNEKWKMGWRPSEEEVKLKFGRKKLNISIEI